jgi:hypothetical protein
MLGMIPIPLELTVGDRNRKEFELIANMLPVGLGDVQFIQNEDDAALTDAKQPENWQPDGPMEARARTPSTKVGSRQFWLVRASVSKNSAKGEKEEEREVYNDAGGRADEDRTIQIIIITSEFNHILYCS